MSIWIANKNEYGEYQFDERYLPEWYTPEYIEVGTLKYYRYIIRNICEFAVMRHKRIKTVRLIVDRLHAQSALRIYLRDKPVDLRTFLLLDWLIFILPHTLPLLHQL